VAILIQNFGLWYLFIGHQIRQHLRQPNRTGKTIGYLFKCWVQMILLCRVVLWWKWFCEEYDLDRLKTIKVRAG